ncbi:hypothetical protein QEJ31_08135 [Pigmentibacter sp. JX0631]|uniref:hypothetical protein n=1 Tax=Pigmentibacter sp. JX0631 TaxID=2976982 RepID=UPI00246844F8|nr:hypothetical protein [Pigmentibacter sp. JX0631]WGL58508.1 hypothetical protein QEJ31_08135 [Pigmentibacter sp. JX0631]
MLKFLKNSYSKTLFLYTFIVLLSLIIRCWYGYYSWYIRDQARIFDLGFKLFNENILPIHGSPVVYVDSVLPGSLQGILAAFPLFFSAGNPYGIICFAQIINLISCIILALIYSRIFNKLNKLFIFFFIVLNPMNIIYSYAWNPSFLILFTTLFFLGIYKVIENKDSNLGNYLLYFPILFMLQLNLQFLIYPVLISILFFKKMIKIPKFSIFSLAVLPGFIFLLPYLIDKFSNKSKPVNNWNLNGNFLDSINFNFENIFSYFHILIRLISFSASEVTRNINKEYLFNSPLLLPFFIFSIIITVFIIVFSALFYLYKNAWKSLILNTTKFKIEDKFNFVLITIPIITTILFVFSITPPSTHKIWSLFPFSFYPLFFMINKMKQNKTTQNKNEFLLPKNLIPKLNAFYVSKLNNYFIFIIPSFYFSTILFGCLSATKVPINYSYVVEKSETFCKNEDKEYIKNILLDEKKAKKEEDYTFSLLCQYWDNLK